MCGFAGVLAQNNDRLSTVDYLQAMGRSITHRGPDDEGCYISPCASLGLVHRRLAIVDLSSAGHQPMETADGRYVLVFNGEIYNHFKLRTELERERHILWNGHSDTETLLAGIQHWGLQVTIDKCVGMFALALWDTVEQSLALVRDRAGEKPLYYGFSRGVFLFGSELKALKAHPAFESGICLPALALMLRHKYVPAPMTIYHQFFKLEPGIVMTVCFAELASGMASIKKQRYWSFNTKTTQECEDLFNGSDVEGIDLLETQLKNTVSEQMLADVQVGAFLSGGTDSSLIAALMQTQSSRPVRTFTVGFDVPQYNEAEHAKAVAQHLGTEHTEIYVTEQDALNVVPKLPAIYDEPFGDSSQIPTYLIAKEAKKHVTVALSGDAGDELFGGYSRYQHALKQHQRLSLIPNSLFSMLEFCLPFLHSDVWRQLDSLSGSGLLSNSIGRLAELSDCNSFGGLYRHIISDWKNPASLLKAPVASMLFHEPEPLLTPQAKLYWMMSIDSQTYLPDDVLVKVDRAAMAASLETRVPMLDHRFIELAAKMPIHFKINNGIGKWALKQMLYRYVPKSLLDRPKTGFGVPTDQWLRGPLKEWAESLLDDHKLQQQGMFNTLIVRKYWREHLSGKRNWQYPLWNLLMFQSWLEEQA